MAIDIECNLTPGMSGLVAELYVPGTDTPIVSNSFAYKTNDKCRVVFHWNATPAANTYRFTVRQSTVTYGLVNARVTIQGNGTHYLNDELVYSTVQATLDNQTIGNDIEDVRTLLQTVNNELSSLSSIITTGNAITNVPVANNGNIEFIVIGDDYLATNEKAFEWLIDPIPGYTTSSVCIFGLENIDDEDIKISVNGSITVVGDKWKLSFDMDYTLTGFLTPGTYKWSVSVGNVTVIINYKECQYTEAINKQT